MQILAGNIRAKMPERPRPYFNTDAVRRLTPSIDVNRLRAVRAGNDALDLPIGKIIVEIGRAGDE